MKNSPRRTPQQTVLFDREDLSQRLMGDIELMRSVAAVFCEDFVEKIANLKHAIQEQNAPQCSAIMHQIKGASANVGGIKLQALALKMELATKSDNFAELNQDLAVIEEEFLALKNAMQQALK